MTSRIRSRPFQDEEDYWRVRRLLVETYAITPLDFNWEVRRWDGWRFYAADASFDPVWRERVHLWETGEGRVVGAVHPEGTGDAHLQVYPEHRDIEEEMMLWALEHLSAPIEGVEGRQLRVFAYEYDEERCALLTRLGFERTDRGGVARRLLTADGPFGTPAVAEGYRLRSTQPGDEEDSRRIAELLNAAFGRDFHTAAEHRNLAKFAPCFRHDLDLLAEAPDGTFACYVGVPYDEDNRRGIFEPVCTHPEHLRRGLAKALMLEGLRRLGSIGAADVTVITGDMEAANRLYDSIGFTETERGFIWRKFLL